MQKTNKSILGQVYPARKPGNQKYDSGFMLIIGGGQYYVGSPALAGLAGFRAGVDMVRILAPQRAADIIAGFSPNLSTVAFQGKLFNEEDLPIAIAMTKSAQTVSGDKAVVVIGGGLGRSEETKQAVLNYLEQTDIKIVIDADGIHALAKKPSIISGKGAILTPHTHEFFILTGKQVKGMTLSEKINIVQQEAAKLDAVILLTGQVDIISNGKQVVINETGSPFMTVGGTGDTLAGICGGLLGQGNDPFLAAQAAAYINGKAGEEAAKKFGPGLLATDLIDFIPQVIR